jgi:hypothetical protein
MNFNRKTRKTLQRDNLEPPADLCGGFRTHGLLGFRENTGNKKRRAVERLSSIASGECSGEEKGVSLKNRG